MINRRKKNEESKIILINPPLSREEQAASFRDISNILPSLGIGYIAAMLEKNKFKVKIIDCQPLNITVEHLVEILKKEAPDVVGFTATIVAINHTIESATLLKKELPNCIVVLGGPHLTSMPYETMKDKCFDIGVIGEGEYTFLELAKNNFKNLNGIKGLIFRKKK